MKERRSDTVCVWLNVPTSREPSTKRICTEVVGWAESTAIASLARASHAARSSVDGAKAGGGAVAGVVPGTGLPTFSYYLEGTHYIKYSTLHKSPSGVSRSLLQPQAGNIAFTGIRTQTSQDTSQPLSSET